MFISCHVQHACFSNSEIDHYTLWTCLDICRALTFILDNILVRYGDTIYRQVVETCIPMGANCAALVVDLVLNFYERDFMLKI